jgi:site-specific DNA-methyltransferase (adenine-specific)
LEDAGFLFKDMLAWIRPSAVHRAQRLSVVFERRSDISAAEKWRGWRLGNLKPVFEPILWFTKPYKIGGTIADNVLIHGVGGYNERALSKYFPEPTNTMRCGFDKNERRVHPAQKPVKLMRALIELVTVPGQIVIDPFCGSGSTLLAAREAKRHFIGVDQDSGYCKIARARLNGEIVPDSATAPEQHLLDYSSHEAA